MVPVRTACRWRKGAELRVCSRPRELELELIQSHMTQKPVLRGDVGACRFTQLTSTAKRQQSIQLVERPLNAKVWVPPSIGSSRYRAVLRECGPFGEGRRDIEVFEVAFEGPAESHLLAAGDERCPHPR